jgi:hypothetical protein
MEKSVLHMEKSVLRLLIRDLVLGLLLCGLVALVVLFSTGEDTSFIYIDF